MKFEVDFGKQKDCWKRIFEYLVSRSFYFSTSPVVRGRKWTICLTYVHPGDCPRPTLPVEQSRIVASTCAPIPSCWPMEKKKKNKKEPKKRKKERKKERKKKTRPDKNILESWPDVGEGFIRRLFVSTWTHTKPRVNTFRDDPKMSHEGII